MLAPTSSSGPASSSSPRRSAHYSPPCLSYAVAAEFRRPGSASAARSQGAALARRPAPPFGGAPPPCPRPLRAADPHGRPLASAPPCKPVTPAPALPSLQWRELDEAQKSKFTGMAKKDKQRYNDESAVRVRARELRPTAHHAATAERPGSAWQACDTVRTFPACSHRLPRPVPTTPPGSRRRGRGRPRGEAQGTGGPDRWAARQEGRGGASRGRWHPLPPPPPVPPSARSPRPARFPDRWAPRQGGRGGARRGRGPPPPPPPRAFDLQRAVAAARASTFGRVSLGRPS